MGKRACKKGHSPSENQHGWPLVVYVWIAGLLFTGYIGAELALGQEPHPVHWSAAAVGAVVGYIVGQVWYRWHGDMV